MCTGLICAVLLTTCSKKSDDSDNPNNTGETITDVDGNVYPVVTIGNYKWMAKNLIATHFNDGTEIPIVSDNTEWKNLTGPGSCYYENDDANKATYGLLYNFNAMNSAKKICPDGWSVPADEGWSALLSDLGDPATAGGKLKETGTSHWESPNDGATNETGFSALPGGARTNTGDFFFKGTRAFFWNSISTSSNGHYYSLLNANAELYSGYTYKTYGYSIRCFKQAGKK